VAIVDRYLKSFDRDSLICHSLTVKLLQTLSYTWQTPAFDLLDVASKFKPRKNTSKFSANVHGHFQKIQIYFGMFVE
jgi:hypothetical protein